MDADDSDATHPRRSGYGTKIFVAIIHYLKRYAKVSTIAVRWVPYIKKPSADEDSKAIQFFVKKLHFDIKTGRSSLYYLELDVMKHFS
jgi:hypothetical protein